MGIFEHWPYVNFHNLNLDWIIEKMKNIDDRFESAQQYAETATEKAAEAEQSAEAAAASAQTAADLVDPMQEIAQTVPDQISVLTGQMSEFMASHAGPTGKTLLWSGNAYIPDTEMQLSDSVENYTDFIIEAQNGSNTWQMIVRPEIMTLVNGPEICLPSQAGNSPTNALRVGHIMLGMDSGSTDVIKIRSNNTWDWSGASDASATSAAVTSSATGTVMSIRRIYGISNPQTNAEVNDIRVGADGTVYQSAGDAVRAQVLDLQRAISIMSGMPASVKNALDTLLHNVAFKNADLYTEELSVLHNWVTSVNLLSITAVFNQGTNVIYDTDSLDTLRQYLTVTANYDNGTSEAVTGYTLSGALTVGTSTITVSYDGKTASFNVIVTEAPLARYAGRVAVAKVGSTGTYANVVYKNNSTPLARACMTAPIVNNGYVFNSADPTKYQLCAYDVQDLTEVTLPSDWTGVVDGYGYHGGTKTVAWADSDSVTTPYVWVSFKKLDNTDFTAEELANMEGTVFTYTVGG